MIFKIWVRAGKALRTISEPPSREFILRQSLIRIRLVFKNLGLIGVTDLDSIS